jgi:Amt family ammonium transporter
LLGAQAVAAGAVIAYSMVMTLIIMTLGGRLVGSRLSTREEAIGLDLSQHGEVAYGLSDPPPGGSTQAAPAQLGAGAAPARARTWS